MNPVPWFASERLSREALEFRRSLLDAGVSVKNDTLNAVDALAKELRRAHLLDKIVYFNGFAGESPTGALYPQIDPNGYGVATNNNFTADDFSERPESKAGEVVFSPGDAITNGGYSTFNTTATGFDAALTPSGTARANFPAIGSEFVNVKGSVYQISFDIVVNSGQDPGLDIVYLGGGTDQIRSPGNLPSGHYDITFTASSGANSDSARLRFETILDVADYEVTNLQVTRVSVPPGAKGDGSTKYLELPFSPDDVGATGGLGVYILEDDSTEGISYMGSTETGTPTAIHILQRVSGPLQRGFYTDVGNIAAASDAATGLLLIDRSSTSSLKLYREGVEIASEGTTASAVLSTENYHVGGRNENGSPGTYSNARFGSALAFKTLSAAQHATLSTIVTRFQERLGRV